MSCGDFSGGFLTFFPVGRVKIHDDVSTLAVPSWKTGITSLFRTLLCVSALSRPIICAQGCY